MGPEWEALAASAASTVVGLMATGAWTQARGLVAGVWRRHRPDDTPRIEAELDRTGGLVGMAREQGIDVIEDRVRADWQSRIAELLTEAPGAHRDLTDTLTRLARLRPDSAAPTVNQHNEVRDNGSLYSSLGDMTING